MQGHRASAARTPLGTRRADLRHRRPGADAIVGVDLDYESVGDSTLMVSVNGTAVRLS